MSNMPDIAYTNSDPAAGTHDGLVGTLWPLPICCIAVIRKNAKWRRGVGLVVEFQEAYLRACMLSGPDSCCYSAFEGCICCRTICTFFVISDCFCSPSKFSELYWISHALVCLLFFSLSGVSI
jgi:hypothetical protein